VASNVAAALQARELPAAIVLAHGLVSRAGLIGANALCDLARSLEEALRDGELAQGDALAQELAAEHARVLCAIDEYLQLQA